MAANSADVSFEAHEDNVC